MRWLDGITSSLGMRLSKLQEMVKHRKPGEMQSTKLQTVGPDLETEQLQQSPKPSHFSRSSPFFSSLALSIGFFLSDSVHSPCPRNQGFGVTNLSCQACKLAEAGEGTLGSEVFWSEKSSAACHTEALSEPNSSYSTGTKSGDSPSHGLAPMSTPTHPSGLVLTRLSLSHAPLSTLN